MLGSDSKIIPEYYHSPMILKNSDNAVLKIYDANGAVKDTYLYKDNQWIKQQK